MAGRLTVGSQAGKLGRQSDLSFLGFFYWSTGVKRSVPCRQESTQTNCL